jgi:DNA-binding MarR family transcriptional regulator
MNNPIREDNHEELVMSLHMTSKVLLKLRKTELSTFGITPEGNIIMTAVQTLGETATSAEIARYIFREPNSVSALLKRMEDKGLVTRVVRGRGGKRQIVVLTAKGQKVYQEINNIRNSSLNDITSFMSDEEEKVFTIQLKQMLKRLFQMLGMTQLPDAIKIEQDE